MAANDAVLNPTAAGFYGMGFSILGSLLGGGLNSYLPPMKSLFVASCFELVPQVGRWAITIYPQPTTSSVIGLICFEAFTGGLLTTGTETGLVDLCMP